MAKRPINPGPGQRLHQVREHRAISQELACALQCEAIDLLRPPGSPPPRYRHWRGAMYWSSSYMQRPAWISLPRTLNEDD
jgi:hypothetical protein